MLTLYLVCSILGGFTRTISGKSLIAPFISKSLQRVVRRAKKYRRENHTLTVVRNRIFRTFPKNKSRF